MSKGVWDATEELETCIFVSRDINDDEGCIIPGV